VAVVIGAVVVGATVSMQVSGQVVVEALTSYLAGPKIRTLTHSKSRLMNCKLHSRKFKHVSPS